MNGMGFNLLSQEEKKIKGKTFMDYAPGHVGDDNYVTTQPTIMPNTKTATKTTNKSGTTKNSATITKTPKRQPFSWVHDNPLSEDDDRMFLEGFYEVDYASSDHEREKRMSQVDKSLKDIRNRKSGDMLRSTKDIFQPVNYSAQNVITPRAEFYAKSDTPIPNTFLHKKINIYDKLDGEQYDTPNMQKQSMSAPAYEYADEIVKNIFNNARSFGIEGSGLSPSAVSELKAARERLRISENMNKGEGYVKGLIGEGVDFFLGNKLKGESIGDKTFSTLIKERVEDIPKDIILDKMQIPSLGDIVKKILPNFTEKNMKDASEYLKAIEQSDQKYLINGYFQRKEFISQLEKAAEQVKSTPKFGYLSQSESDELKEKVLTRINTIIQMNKNYQYEKELLDSQWEKIKNR